MVINNTYVVKLKGLPNITICNLLPSNQHIHFPVNIAKRPYAHTAKPLEPCNCASGPYCYAQSKPVFSAPNSDS